MASLSTLFSRLIEWFKSVGLGQLDFTLFGVVNIGFKRKPRLRVIAEGGGIGQHGDPTLDIWLYIENFGSAQAKCIQCNVFQFLNRPLSDIKWDDKPGRIYGIERVNGESTFHFAENPEHALIEGKTRMFASFSMNRHDAPFEIHYLIAASDFGAQKGKLAINPSQLANG